MHLHQNVKYAQQGHICQNLQLVKHAERDALHVRTKQTVKLVNLDIFPLKIDALDVTQNVYNVLILLLHVCHVPMDSIMNLHMEIVSRVQTTVLIVRTISNVHNAEKDITMIISSVFPAQQYFALTVMDLVLLMFVQCARKDFI